MVIRSLDSKALSALASSTRVAYSAENQHILSTSNLKLSQVSSLENRWNDLGIVSRLYPRVREANPGGGSAERLLIGLEV